ncbi:uncharacterized protein LAJ45_03500 [Morchella importuna]|uniref:Uncharacterized protein n=1 Tax=Morchella conica CCBAS932 TaxID=1392247 RepID=A0A3N4KNK5_9PEZI|nr:uncharacterized protein LAJ45_03500 [Morchella importuna]KAH8152659.1 hypothetical protein LAJ45_03500 [Morchella importuna]RPB11028.1 hypothetical protein P167DRAFT_537052 [Morchella conica CCBAS932]
MSAPQASFIPLLIVVMVTWKISYSKKTSKFTGASQSMRSAGSRSFNNNKNIKNEPTLSAISERLYARNVKQSRPVGKSSRSSLSNAKRILTKSESGHGAAVARTEEREKRDRRT